MDKDYSSMITNLKNRVNRLAQENAKIEGEISATTKRMKKEQGIHSVEEAKKMITKLNGEITEHVAEMESEIYEIKEILDGFDE